MRVRFPNRTNLYIDEVRRSCRVAKEVPDRAMLDTLARRSVTEQRIASGCNLMSAEVLWKEAKRPFFNLYPSIIPSLGRSTLDIMPSQIPESIVHDVQSICVKLPVESSIPQLSGASHFMICIADMTVDGCKSMSVSYHTIDASHSVCARWDETVEHARSTAPSSADIDTTSDLEQRPFIVRLAVGVMLLAADPDYIEPIILKRDEGRQGDLDKFVQRAKRRGIFGFSIGKHIECSPHVRRPHFAIRWTGRGSAIPKLVPVKGCLVNRKAMTTVPTGYEAAQ